MSSHQDFQISYSFRVNGRQFLTCLRISDPEVLNPKFLNRPADCTHIKSCIEKHKFYPHPDAPNNPKKVLYVCWKSTVFSKKSLQARVNEMTAKTRVDTSAVRDLTEAGGMFSLGAGPQGAAFRVFAVPKAYRGPGAMSDAAMAHALVVQQMGVAAPFPKAGAAGAGNAATHVTREDPVSEKKRRAKEEFERKKQEKKDADDAFKLTVLGQATALAHRTNTEAIEARTLGNRLASFKVGRDVSEKCIAMANLLDKQHTILTAAIAEKRKRMRFSMTTSSLTKKLWRWPR